MQQRRIDAGKEHLRLGRKKISSRTGGFSQARQRLPQSTVQAIHDQVLSSIGRELRGDQADRVLYVDGTGFQLCDTPHNQDEYPQPTPEGRLWLSRDAAGGTSNSVSATSKPPWGSTLSVQNQPT